MRWVVRQTHAKVKRHWHGSFLFIQQGSFMAEWRVKLSVTLIDLQGFENLAGLKLQDIWRITSMKKISFTLMLVALLTLVTATAALADEPMAAQHGGGYYYNYSGHNYAGKYYEPYNNYDYDYSDYYYTPRRYSYSNSAYYHNSYNRGYYYNPCCSNNNSYSYNRTYHHNYQYNRSYYNNYDCYR